MTGVITKSSDTTVEITELPVKSGNFRRLSVLTCFLTCLFFFIVFCTLWGKNWGRFFLGGRVFVFFFVCGKSYI